MIKAHTVLLGSAAAFALSACATVEENVVEKIAETYKAELTGANEPGGGDADGYGAAEISVSDDLDQICWDLNGVRGIGPITGAHTHKGLPGVNGPVVLTLKPANEGGIKGCTSSSEWKEDALKDNFRSFYVNVHTAQYPNGAIRGQLHQ
ncbi:MAG: CHRD domain-containing protein [Alphaproteobacteria bacterium]